MRFSNTLLSAFTYCICNVGKFTTDVEVPIGEFNIRELPNPIDALNVAGEELSESGILTITLSDGPTVFHCDNKYFTVSDWSYTLSNSKSGYITIHYTFIGKEYTPKENLPDFNKYKNLANELTQEQKIVLYWPELDCNMRVGFYWEMGEDEVSWEVSELLARFPHQEGLVDYINNNCCTDFEVMNDIIQETDVYKEMTAQVKNIFDFIHKNKLDIEDLMD